jgi:tRNA dimethylallyltransferase
MSAPRIAADFQRPVLVVAGPTASGKSALALAAALAFDGTVINADSMQVYRELSILTARPSAEAEAQTPHRLFGFLSATERCSVGRWLKLATAEIETAWAAGRLPIVVGGSGLYLKALLEGLSPVPTVPEAIREEARALHDRLGGEGMRDALAELDPVSAAKLPAADRQRLIRAYEVARATGKALSTWQAENRPTPLLEARFATLGLLPPREALYDAIDVRLKRMIDRGALAEVAAIQAMTLESSLPAARALGVRELARHLAGEVPLEEALRQAQQASRRYAKRQLTWLRHQIILGKIMNAQFSESIKEETFAFIRNRLLTAQL